MAKHNYSLFPLLLLHLLALVASSSINDVSIDCGASDSHTDENGIVWVGDTSYIQNGESLVLQDTNSVPEVAMSTLRVFSSRKKNCYPISIIGGGKILVRASFFYGNYDGKSLPPTFALQFDGNSWTTVVTSLDGLVYYETVYVVDGDGTSVCVAQTKTGQLPFISAIEVRSLDANVYEKINSSSALFLWRRVAFGASSPVRSPDDIYDRIWAPSVVPAELSVLKSDSSNIETSVKDEPPATALMTAITPTNASTYITLGTKLPDVAVPIYINMYFAELMELSSTENRTFAIFMDDKQLSKPISPPYQSVDEYYIDQLMASGSTEFALKPMPESTLPPIINAMEVFSVSDPLSSGTDANDVKALGILQSAFDVLQDWSGDPCLPVSYNWDWVGCSSDPIPRITAMNLEGLGLSGELPDFSSMGALEIIDLHNNSLSGAIPDSLGSLPNLKELNLADNSFSGPVPSSLSNNKKIKLVITGNPNLCASGESCETMTSSSPNSPAGPSKSYSPSRKKSKSNLGLILGLTIPLSFIAIIIFGAYLFLQNRRGSVPIAAFDQGQTASPDKEGAPPKTAKVSQKAQLSTTFNSSWQSILSLVCIGYNCYRQCSACLDDEEKCTPDDNENEEEDIEQQMPPDKVEECTAEAATDRGTRSESRVPPNRPRMSKGKPRGRPAKPRHSPSTASSRGPANKNLTKKEEQKANDESEQAEEEEEHEETEEMDQEMESDSQLGMEEEALGEDESVSHH